MRKSIALLMIAVISVIMSACNAVPEATVPPAPTSTPVSTPISTNRPEPTEVPDSAIVAAAEDLYWSVNRYGQMWPYSFDLEKKAGVYSVQNINVVSCEIGSRYATRATVLFKGNFSGYDEYGRFVGKYIFTATVDCDITAWGYIDVDLVGARLWVEEA